MIKVAIALVHHPVLNKHGETIGSAVTNLDLHDIARAARTFGVQKYYITTPYNDQQELIKEIVDHWQTGHGATYNPARKEALSQICVTHSLDEAIADAAVTFCERPLVVTTSAKRQQELVANLSGGWKQRLALACSILHNPPILFLDEPTSGIDPPARRIFWRQITALAAKGTTVIITTHFMDEAEYCDRIMIQDQGKMLILGTPEEVRNRGGQNLTMNEAFIAIVENSRRKEEL